MPRFDTVDATIRRIWASFQLKLKGSSIMAQFSKQDYVHIAQVLDDVARQQFGELHPDCDCCSAQTKSARRWQIVSDMQATVAAFADMFGADNPNFDRPRFVAACEGEVVS